MMLHPSKVLLLVSAACILYSFYLLVSVRHAQIPSFLDDKITAPTEPARGACALISPLEIERVADSTEFSIHSFANGKQVTDKSVLVGSPVCFLIAVPQTPLLEYKDVPVPGKGPDNIHFFANSSSVRHSFPPPRPLPGQLGLDKQITTDTIIYYSETELNDAGTYNVYADHEWGNWEWATSWYDDGTRNVTVYPTGLEKSFPDHQARWHVRHTTSFYNWTSVTEVHKFPRTITVQGSLEEQRRPPCSAHIPAFQGRWYHNITSTRNIHEELVDEWGYGWDADKCEMHFYTEDEIMDCFADRTIHAYGASNLRRNSKVIISGGRVCHNQTDRCQYDDGAQDILRLVADNQTGQLVEEYDRDWHWSEEDPGLWRWAFGRGGKFYYWGVGSISLMFETWTRRWYDPVHILSKPEDQWEPDGYDHMQKLFVPGRDLAYNAHARPPATVQDKADLVILSFGAWDAAFSPDYDSFSRTLPYFRDAVMEAYPESQILLRLSTGYCCRHGFEDYRRMTGVRIQHFDDLVRDAFRVAPGGVTGMGGRVIVMDPAPMTGRPEAVADYEEVKTNHPRFSHVRIETQIMLNSVCMINRDGKAQMRETFSRKY